MACSSPATTPRPPGARAPASPEAAIGRDFKPHELPIALHVDDVEAACAALEERGVTFLHRFDSGVCHNAFFQDPDGNAFLLHHRYAPQG